MRWSLGVCLCFAVLHASTAAAFTGPWDSAHEPLKIAASDVTAQATLAEQFQLSIYSGAWCASAQFVPMTVTVSDPSGSVTYSLESTLSSNPCLFTQWAGGDFQKHSVGALNAEAILGGGASPYGPGSPSEITATATDPLPFFYEVSTPSGVIAQGAWSSYSNPVGAEKSNDITECQRQHSDIHSSDGEVYCYLPTEATEIRYHEGGWPAPPQAETPEQPESKYFSLRQRPHAWITYALHKRFPHTPHLQISHCAWKGAQRLRCDVRWNHSPYEYAGWVEVGAVNVYKGGATSGLRITRSAHHRKPLTVNAPY